MTFLEDWFEEVWNKGRIEVIDEKLLPHAKIHGLSHPDGTEVTGKKAFLAFYKQLRASFSEIHVEVEHTVTEGDFTAALCRVTAVHTGDGLGWPATGKTVEFSGLNLARLKDGKCAEAWNYFDFGSLFRSLQEAEPGRTQKSGPDGR